MNNCAAIHAEVAEQRSSGGAVAKHPIFHDRLTSPNRLKEILEVIIAIDCIPAGATYFSYPTGGAPVGCASGYFCRYSSRMRFCIASVKVPMT